MTGIHITHVSVVDGYLVSYWRDVESALRTFRSSVVIGPLINGIVWRKFGVWWIFNNVFIYLLPPARTSWSFKLLFKFAPRRPPHRFTLSFLIARPLLVECLPNQLFKGSNFSPSDSVFLSGLSAELVHICSGLSIVGLY